MPENYMLQMKRVFAQTGAPGQSCFCTRAAGPAPVRCWKRCAPF
ncbi:MAG: hypothetical protein ACLRWF_05345 [Ruthenibacterium sp.]